MRNNPLLKNYSEAWYKIELPMSKKTMQIKPIHMKENKSFVTVIEEAEEKNDIKLFLAGTINLMLACSKECKSSDILKLNIVDFVYLSNKLTSITKGSKLKRKIQCEDKCFQPRPDIDKKIPYETLIEFDIDECEISNMNNKKSFILTANETKYEIYMKDFVVGMLLEHPEILKNSNTFNDIFETIITFVDFIVIDSVKYDDLTKNEIEEFLLKLTSYQLKPFGDYIKNIPKLILKKKFKCANCKKEQEIEIKDLSNFLE